MCLTEEEAKKIGLFAKLVDELIFVENALKSIEYSDKTGLKSQLYEIQRKIDLFPR